MNNKTNDTKINTEDFKKPFGSHWREKCVRSPSFSTILEILRPRFFPIATYRPSPLKLPRCYRSEFRPRPSREGFQGRRPFRTTIGGPHAPARQTPRTMIQPSPLKFPPRGSPGSCQKLLACEAKASSMLSVSRAAPSQTPLSCR